MKVISAWKDVPRFETEEEEAQFWLDARLDARLMSQSLQKIDNRESTTITLRFDPRMLARIKRIARERYLNYQSMIKQWLSERLEKERPPKNAPGGSFRGRQEGGAQEY
jgi:predicted DNA binding CopG/RHH family protein